MLKSKQSRTFREHFFLETVRREESFFAACLMYGTPELVRKFISKGHNLKELETDGLVERKQYDEMPVRVEYNLTKKAKSLIPILLELKKWGENNL